MNEMRALSLTQPWASLVAVGAKQIETRSWGTNYRGPLAIHAAKGFPKAAKGAALSQPFRNALRAGGIDRLDDLPLGAIIATAQLTGCIEIHRPEQLSLWNKIVPHEGSDEFAFGDYTPGRWMWLLTDVVPLPEPIPARGSLGLWMWTPRVVEAGR